MPQPGDTPPEQPDDGGMINLDAYEAIRADEVKEEAARFAARDVDALPTVSDEKLREMKEKARRQIDERLKAKRKQRRLMRGGDM